MGLGKLPVFYLEQVRIGSMPRNPFSFLQFVRSPSGKTQQGFLTMARQAYLASLTSFCDAYRVWAIGKSIDSLVRVPSSRCDASPYAEAILKSLPHIRDYSEFFTKDPNWKSGIDGDIDHARRAISVGDFSAAAVNSLAIVDDTLNRGTSIRVVFEAFQRRDLPRAAEIRLIVPLVLRDVI